MSKKQDKVANTPAQTNDGQQNKEEPIVIGIFGNKPITAPSAPKPANNEEGSKAAATPQVQEKDQDKPKKPAQPRMKTTYDHYGSGKPLVSDEHSLAERARRAVAERRALEEQAMAQSPGFLSRSIGWISFFLASCWVIGVAYYMDRVIGWHPLAEMTLDQLALMVITITFPLMLLWMIYSHLRREESLRRYAERLVHQAGHIQQKPLSLPELPDPELENRLKNLSQHLEEQTQKLAEISNKATERLEKARLALQQETGSFSAASEKAARESDQFSNVLARRSEELDKLTRTLDDRSQRIETNLGHQVTRLEGFAQSGLSRLEDLDKRIASFNERYEQAMQKRRTEANEISARMAEEGGRLDTMGSKALDSIKSAISLFSEQTQVLEDVALRSQSGVDSARQLFKDSTETINRQVSTIEESLNRAKQLRLSLEDDIAGLEKMTDIVSGKTTQLTGQIENQGRELDSLTSRTLAKLEMLAEAMGDRVAELSEKGAELRKGMVVHIEQLRGDMGHTETEMDQLVAKMEAHVTRMADKAGEVRTSVLDIDTNLLDHRRRAEAMADALKGYVGEFDGLVAELQARAEAAGQSLSSVSDALETRSENIAKAGEAAALGIESMSGKLENNFNLMRGGLDETSEQIETIRSQMGSFNQDAAGLAERIARNIESLRTVFDKETGQFDASLKRMTAPLSQITEMMRAEADQVAAQALSLREQIEQAQDSSHHVSESTDKAMKRLEDATVSLSLRMRELSDRSDAVSRNMTHISEAMSRQSADFDTMSDRALERARHMFGQMAAMQKNLDSREAPASARPAPLAQDEHSLRTAEIARSVAAMMQPSAQEDQDETPLDLTALANRIEEKAARDRAERSAEARTKLEIAPGAETAKRSVRIEPVVEAQEATNTADTPPIPKALLPEGEKTRRKDQNISDKITEQAGAAAAAMGRGLNEDFLSSARKVVETLNSLALDINRMINGETSEKMLRAYHKGDSGIFTRSILGLRERGVHDRIAARFKDDTEFRRFVTAYIEDFEDMFDETGAQPGGEMLMNTFMTSDTGRLYLLLCTSIRRAPIGLD